MSPGAQPDLLTWTPAQAAMAFEERDVRGASIGARISRAVAVALAECGKTRRAIARAMTDYLGADVTQNMLDAYASVGRAEHNISLPRFMALVHATADRRLLELLAAPMGWAVIDRRHLALIEVAILREQEDKLRRRRKALARGAREGAI